MNPVSAVPVVRRAYRSCAAGAVRSCPVRKVTAVCRKGPADAEVADTLSGAGVEVSALHGGVGWPKGLPERCGRGGTVLSGPKGNRSLPQKAGGCRSCGYAIRGRRGGFRTTRPCRGRRRGSAFRGAGSARPERPVRLEMPAASKSLPARKSAQKRRSAPARRSGQRAGPSFP